MLKLRTAVSAFTFDDDDDDDDETDDDDQAENTLSNLDETPQYDEMVLRLSPTEMTTDNDEFGELFRKYQHCKSQGHIHADEDIYFRGLPSTKITAVRGRLVSGKANASVVSGGVGQSHVCIRLSSPKGCGYKYCIEIYGKKTCTP
ncbi:hypothetical protein HF086_014238 [Spodoptera exigua]|uniref:Uncharacterized protein n=1 Tax=Spodoptera exigua TaxID=7107 RepID=A0A922MGD6_SPOEX|nr:hypothetical protein HF086_014238 [Spodoptera exigua]